MTRDPKEWFHQQRGLIRHRITVRPGEPGFDPLAIRAADNAATRIVVSGCAGAGRGARTHAGTAAVVVPDRLSFGGRRGGQCGERNNKHNNVLHFKSPLFLGLIRHRATVRRALAGFDLYFRLVFVVVSMTLAAMPSSFAFAPLSQAIESGLVSVR
jgi:hypothetical protein